MVPLLFWSISFLHAALHACTLTHVHTSSESELVIGRTMELAFSPLSSLWDAWTTPATDDSIGALLLGVKISTVEFVGEGMNTFGLTMSAHTFHQSEYQTPPSSSSSLTTVTYLDLVPYVLTHFKTVEETVYALQHRLCVVSASSVFRDPTTFLHWSVQDAEGKSIVVEYLGGTLRLFDSSQIGVMTNDPDYDFQLKNLNAFAGLSNRFVEFPNPVRYDADHVFPEWKSHGFNLYGLPGDFSPPSRFVRTFILKQLAKQPKTLAEAFVLITQLLNAVTIPHGTVGPFSKTDAGFDFTHWSSIRIPKKRTLYFRTYQQSTWKKIDLNKLDFSVEQRFMLNLRHTRDDYIDSVDALPVKNNNALLRAEK